MTCTRDIHKEDEKIVGFNAPILNEMNGYLQGNRIEEHIISIIWHVHQFICNNSKCKHHVFVIILVKKEGEKIANFIVALLILERENKRKKCRKRKQFTEAKLQAIQDRKQKILNSST